MHVDRGGDHTALHSFPTRRSSDLNFRPVNGAMIPAQIDGEIKSIRFNNGDIVEQGQVLFILDDRVEQAERERLRSEEHTSELQSRPHLVCRLLLEKKNGAHIYPDR